MNKTKVIIYHASEISWLLGSYNRFMTLKNNMHSFFNLKIPEVLFIWKRPARFSIWNIRAYYHSYFTRVISPEFTWASQSIYPRLNAYMGFNIICGTVLFVSNLKYLSWYAHIFYRKMPAAYFYLEIARGIAYFNNYLTPVFSPGYTCTSQSLYHGVIEYTYHNKMWYCTVCIIFKIFIKNAYTFQTENDRGNENAASSFDLKMRAHFHCCVQHI